MQTQNATISLDDANKYFESILSEIEEAIVFRIRTVSLVGGKGRRLHGDANIPANDNAVAPQPPDPSLAVRQEVREAPSRRSTSDGCARPLPRGLRPMTAAEVRARILDDSDLPSEILFRVYQDFTRAVERGGFRGEEDRALVFEIVRCQTIKGVRPRADLLLRTVLATDGSEALDHIPCDDSEAPEERHDHRSALLRLRPIVERLSDEEHALLSAKLDGSLIEFARQRGENPVTVRSRAKRLFDRIVQAVQEGFEGDLPRAAGI